MAETGRHHPMATPEREGSRFSALGLAGSSGIVIAIVGILIAFGLVGLLRFHFWSGDAGANSSRITPSTTYSLRPEDGDGAPNHLFLGSSRRNGFNSEDRHATAKPIVVPRAKGGLRGKGVAAGGSGEEAGPDSETPAEEGQSGAPAQPTSPTAAGPETDEGTGSGTATEQNEAAAQEIETQAARSRQEAEESADMLESAASRVRQAAQAAFDAGRGTRRELDRALLLESQEQQRAQRMREAAAAAEAQARERARRVREGN